MKPIVGIFAEVDGNLVTSVRRPYVSAREQAQLPTAEMQNIRLLRVQVPFRDAKPRAPLRQCFPRFLGITVILWAVSLLI